MLDITGYNLILIADVSLLDRRTIHLDSLPKAYWEGVKSQAMGRLWRVLATRPVLGIFFTTCTLLGKSITRPSSE